MKLVIAERLYSIADKSSIKKTNHGYSPCIIFFAEGNKFLQVKATFSISYTFKNIAKSQFSGFQ
jgi:hypothetical protein